MTPLDDVDLAEGCEPTPLSEIHLENRGEGDGVELYATIWSNGCVTLRWVAGAPNNAEREEHRERMLAWHQRCSGKYLLQ